MDRRKVMHDVAHHVLTAWDRDNNVGIDDGAMWSHVVNSFALMSDKQVADVAAVMSADTLFWDDDALCVFLRIDGKEVAMRNI